MAEFSESFDKSTSPVKKWGRRKTFSTETQNHSTREGIKKTDQLRVTEFYSFLVSSNFKGSFTNTEPTQCMQVSHTVNDLPASPKWNGSSTLMVIPNSMRVCKNVKADVEVKEKKTK